MLSNLSNATCQATQAYKIAMLFILYVDILMNFTKLSLNYFIYLNKYFPGAVTPVKDQVKNFYIS